RKHLIFPEQSLRCQIQLKTGLTFGGASVPASRLVSSLAPPKLIQHLKTGLAKMLNTPKLRLSEFQIDEQTSRIAFPEETALALPFSGVLLFLAVARLYHPPPRAAAELRLAVHSAMERVARVCRRFLPRRHRRPLVHAAP